MPDVLEQLMADAPPPLSIEVDSRQLIDDVMEELGVGNIDNKVRSALQALYGAAFPLLEPNPDDASWVKWSKTLWDRHRSGVQNRLHLVERNRLFRPSEVAAPHLLDRVV